jgi:hypothetical protein
MVNTTNVEKVDVALNFEGSSFDGVRSWFNNTITSVRAGDDESLTTVMLSLSFIIAGIWVYRRI